MSKSDDDVDDDWESLEEQIDHFISSTEKTTSRAYETEQWQSIEKGRANISSWRALLLDYTFKHKLSGLLQS